MPTLSPSEHDFPALAQLYELRDKIADVHPFLADLFPVALVIDDQFHVFEPGEAGYAFAFAAPTPRPIPAGVRAAFPLEELGGRQACVVTPDAFDTEQGLVEVFHEFVHCQQWAQGEPELRETLALARAARESGDMMWELAYPFPYDAPAVVTAYRASTKALDAGDGHGARTHRCAFHTAISESDWEYATWQEWKEGLARYIENLIRVRLGLPINRNGAEGALSRVSFYAGGASLITSWVAQDPGLATNLPELYAVISRA